MNDRQDGRAFAVPCRASVPRAQLAWMEAAAMRRREEEERGRVPPPSTSPAAAAEHIMYNVMPH